MFLIIFRTLQDNAIVTLAPLAGCAHLKLVDLSFNRVASLAELRHLSGCSRLKVCVWGGGCLLGGPLAGVRTRLRAYSPPAPPPLSRPSLTLNAPFFLLLPSS